MRLCRLDRCCQRDWQLWQGKKNHFDTEQNKYKKCYHSAREIMSRHREKEHMSKNSFCNCTEILLILFLLGIYIYLSRNMIWVQAPYQLLNLGEYAAPHTLGENFRLKVPELKTSYLNLTCASLVKGAGRCAYWIQEQEHRNLANLE